MSEPARAKRPDHHDFDEVIRALRQLRARGTHGKTVLTWRGQDIVHVEHTDGRTPGEPLDL